MSGNIWILAEHWRGQLSEITFEMLALGRELADGLSVPLEAVLLGHDAKGLAQELGAADKVLYVDDPALADPTPETHSRVLAHLVEERQPHAVLVGLTNVASDVAALTPARLKAPFVNFCEDVRVEDGGLRARCLLYGGKMQATVAVAATPAFLGVQPGVRSADAGRAARSPEIEEVAVSLAEPPRVQFKTYIEPDVADVDISVQDVLVSVGRGMDTHDNLDLAEELAAALGGAVSASRPVVDQGWLPLSRQVGKSGVTVKPKLYLAAGISGAPEHVEGIKGAELIIAINTDPDAPIFNVAHYGVVGDALEVLPALTESLQAVKG
jgi:electron transfer flavoprotein alpha subunit